MSRLSDAQYELVYAHIEEAMEAHEIDPKLEESVTSAVFETIWDNSSWGDLFDEIDGIVENFQ